MVHLYPESYAERPNHGHAIFFDAPSATSQGVLELLLPRYQLFIRKVMPYLSPTFVTTTPFRRVGC